MSTRVLNLRVGDVVRVRPLNEIVVTLDSNSALDFLPFMPEMAKFCGREFRVLKRADKVNDLVTRSGLRRMHDAVLLDGVRCDGDAHGGCQALCQILWKESWLVKSNSDRPNKEDKLRASLTGSTSELPDACIPEFIVAATQQPASGETIFSCQATGMLRASSPLAWWDPRQYYRDIRSGNVGIGEALRVFGFWIFTLMLKVGCYRALVHLYNTVQRIFGGHPFPFVSGKLRKTPAQHLDLRVGELVQVKEFDEIIATLGVNNKNRGLYFDAEMVKYCGGQYKVLARVDRLIEEASGRMLHLRNDCLILEGVTVRGDFHRFYSQNEYPLWREIWLRRASAAERAPSFRDTEIPLGG